MPLCAQCGQENPEGARFCNECAAPLTAEHVATREERKVVTILFADLVGFTGRAERLDPEDVRAMLSPYFARLRSELERFGGTVEKFIGDAVMAVFGAPVAHEDDPERAVRAALAVRDAILELNEGEPTLDLHVRVAVNTGEVVVALGARPSEGEGMVAGDIVNTSARLQAAAPVDGILVGETTYRATERAIEYERRGLADIERSLEITESGSPERTRGFINLASTHGELGELRRSIELHEEGLREAEQTGAPGPVRWLRAERAWDEYLTGRWNEAVAHVDELLAEAETRERHYMDVAAWEVRALIRLARDDTTRALADSEHALALARAAQDPQVLFPVLAFQSKIMLATGRRSDAVSLAEELLALLGASRTSFVSDWSAALAIVLTALGRSSDMEGVVENATISTRWLDAARAYAAGAFAEAADVYAEIGAVPDEAYARVRAAEALVDAGRRVDADAQLQRALAFYRSVGATAYIREGERLLAASA
jgi:class 3 adenylate cyclase